MSGPTIGNQNPDQLSRRGFLRRSALLFGALGVPSILSACSAAAPATTQAPPTANAAAPVAAVTPAAPTPAAAAQAAPTQAAAAQAAPTQAAAAQAAPTQAAPAQAAPTQPAAAGTPTKGGTLVIGMEAELSSLDPAVMTGTSTFRPVSSMFDMLVNLFDTTSKIQPDLAESWDVAPDGTSVTMHLRKGVTFHDGTDVDAAAVVFSFERMLNEQDPNYFGPYAFPRFYPAYQSSTAVDPGTVKFNLSEPDATFLSALVWNTGSIISPTAAKAAGKDFSSKPVGTGAFKFVSWDKNVKTTMDRFDGYWRGPANLDRLVWLPIVEEAARFNQLASGQVDFIVSLDPQFIPQVQANQNLQLIQTPSLQTWWVYLNTHEPHLKDVRVRQALNYAIDVNSLIKNVLKGTAVPSNGWSWANTWSYESTATTYPYNPDKAKQLLADAGYPDGFDLNYIVPESGSGMIAPKEIATAMQADLKKVGINANITTLEWISYIAETAKGMDNIQGKQYGMAQESWLNPVDDPGLYVEYCTTGQDPKLGLNIGYYDNKQYADLLAKARTTVDQNARADSYKQAQKIFADEAPWIFMFNANYVTAASKKVNGVILNPDQNVIHLKDVWKAS